MLSSGSRGGDCPAGAKPWKDRGTYHPCRRALLVPYITKSLNPGRLLSGSSLWRALARLVVTGLLLRRFGKTLAWVVLAWLPRWSRVLQFIFSPGRRLGWAAGGICAGTLVHNSVHRR